MKKINTLLLVLLTAWCAFGLNASPLMGKICVQDSDLVTSSAVGIFGSDGKRVKQATVISGDEGKRIKLRYATKDGKFLPQLVHSSGNVLPLVTESQPSQVTANATMTLSQNGLMPKNDNPFTHLVVSQDGTEVAFVPPGYQGNIQLRPCGRIRLDPTLLQSGEEYAVFIVWKNCLAGRYATCGNIQPGDPENPNHDWRFRPFFTVTTMLNIGATEENPLEHIYLPPGEVSVSVITKKQAALIDEFSSSNLSKKDVLDVSLPPTSGIHRVFQSKTTIVPLRTGTCFRGKVVSESKSLPDWNDAGFVGASITFSDHWTSRLDWIPGYDLSKGVNHYFDVLHSDVGLQARARALAASVAIMKVDGSFVTLPIPRGNYTGRFSRPDLTAEISGIGYFHSRGPQRVQIAVPLRVLSKPPVEKLLSSIAHLAKARVAIWGGDLETARLQLELAENNPVKSDFVSDSTKEIRAMIQTHSRLLEMINDRNYNLQAGEFLLSQAKGFLQHYDFFYAQQLIDHARSFPVQFTKQTGTPDDVQAMLEKARLEILTGSKQIPWISSSHTISNENESVKSEIVDLGELTFSVRKSKNQDEPKAPFLPLVNRASSQPEKIGVSSTKPEITGKPSPPGSSANSITPKWFAAISELKAINGPESKEFGSYIERLTDLISKEFDKKLDAREAEISKLAAKLEAARESLEQRKSNRDEIVKRHLRKMLLENGIKTVKPSEREK